MYFVLKPPAGVALTGCFLYVSILERLESIVAERLKPQQPIVVFHSFVGQLFLKCFI